MPPPKTSNIFLPLEVNFPEDEKVRRLLRYGKDARGCRDLLVQMWLYCKRNASDGFVPAEEIGIMVYPDSLRNGLRDAERIVDVGLAESTDHGFYMPGFTRRNKTKAEIEQATNTRVESGAASGAFGNHKKWHLNRGVINPNCDFCTSGTARVDPIASLGSTRENGSGNDRSENREQRKENRTTTNVALTTNGTVTRTNRVDPRPRSTADQRVAQGITLAERLEAQGM